MSTPQSIESIVQFVGGTQAKWNDVTKPIPSGMFVIAMDTLVIKRGNGTALYQDLPVVFNLNDVLNVMGGLASKADQTTVLALAAQIVDAVAKAEQALTAVTTLTEQAASGAFGSFVGDCKTPQAQASYIMALSA